MATSQIPRSNIEIIFVDWLDAIRRGDLDGMAASLAPDVVHRGVESDWVCRDRQEVLENARRRAGRTPDVQALELVAAGDHVVMTIRASDVGAGAIRGQASIVFTLREGLIVHIQDYARRADALAAAGASGDWR